MSCRDERSRPHHRGNLSDKDAALLECLRGNLLDFDQNQLPDICAFAHPSDIGLGGETKSRQFFGRRLQVPFDARCSLLIAPKSIPQLSGEKLGKITARFK